MKIYDIEKVKNPIVYISIAFISGSLFFSFLDNRYIWLSVLTVSLFFITVYKSSGSIFTSILLMFFSLSIINNYVYYNLDVSHNFQGEITVTEKKSYNTIGEFKGRLLEIVGDTDDFKVGEKISIKGEFTKDKKGDYGTIGIMKVNKVINVHDTYKRKLYSLREKVYENLKNNIGERKSALIVSAAFGYTDNLDNVDKSEMRNLGVIHAVSVSGLHVALIYAVIKKILGRRLGLLITAVYVILTGAAFSSIRALIMIILLNSAVIFRKKYNPLGAIAFSAFIITLFKPYAPYQIGFQLSFLAALGIILFFRLINNKLYKLPKYLNDTLSTCISAQVFTSPVMMIQFGECSLLFLLGNLILVPLLTVLIYLGNLMLVMCYIPKVFDFLSYVTLKVIDIFDNVTDYLNLIFSGSFYVNKSTALLYSFVLLSLFFYKKGLKSARFLPIIISFMLLINIYSPVLRIDYLKEGGVLISYKGERKIAVNSNNVDMKKLKEKNMADEGYRKAESISIGSRIKLSSKGKNYILNLKGREYLLRINNKENKDKNYDIIDFVNNEADGFYIINDKLYCF